jgi:MFS family permease
MQEVRMSTAMGTILTGKRRWFALIPVALGVAMIILDATVVNVVLPTLIKEVGLTTTDAEWVTAAYSLTFASLLIVAGRLADRFGRRLIFVIGLIVFVVSSVLVAMSDSPVSIIGARALQGVGAAMILPSSLSILNSVFVGKSRAAAFAVWGATIGGMAALGPLVGGWLTTDFSWHWAFLINVPIGIVVLIGVLVFVIALLFQSTITAVFRVALYRYATDDQVLAGFDREALESAFVPKKKRRGARGSS